MYFRSVPFDAGTGRAVAAHEVTIRQPMTADAPMNHDMSCCGFLVKTMLSIWQKIW